MNTSVPPVGDPVKRLPSGRVPDARTLYGQAVTVAPLSVARHGRELFEALVKDDPDQELWAFMRHGPFEGYGPFAAWLSTREARSDLQTVVFVPRETGKAQGLASYQRIDAENGVCEVGAIILAQGLKKSRAATEAIYLMLRHLFDELAYRRVEWLCNALNETSRGAAERLGFTFEGVFRQHMIVKGRNRDTAWYSLLDEEWPKNRRRLETWLDEGNFGQDGRQLTSLSDLEGR